jgi:hypothetical protein
LLLGLVGFQLRFYYLFYPILFGLVAVFLYEPNIFPNLRIPISQHMLPLNWIVILLIIAVTSAFAAERILEDLRSEPRYLLLDAEFLANVSERGEPIIVRKPHLAYLAGLKPVFAPATTPDEFLKASVEYGARFIVYSNSDASLWPGLNSLRNPDDLSGQFQLIYEDHNDHIKIYKIVY